MKYWQTYISRRPYVVTAAWTSAPMSSAELASAFLKMAFPALEMTSRVEALSFSYPPARKSGVMSLHTTLAPSEASAKAIARPRPDEEPVTMATLPVRLKRGLGNSNKPKSIIKLTLGYQTFSFSYGDFCAFLIL